MDTSQAQDLAQEMVGINDKDGTYPGANQKVAKKTWMPPRLRRVRWFALNPEMGAIREAAQRKWSPRPPRTSESM
jgi:hypothetical protein